MKKITLTLSTAALLQGCATILLYSAPTTSTVVEQKDIAQDTVRAIGHPANMEKFDELILIGDKFTYRITDGHRKIELMTKLNPSHIKMENATIIEVKADSLYGRINFVYEKYNNDYSHSETNILKTLCSKVTAPSGKWFGFGVPHVNYSCWIYVSGHLYSGQTLEFSHVTYLSKSQRVRLISKGEPITEVDRYKVIQKIALIPVGILLDIITLPIQIIIFLEQTSKSK